MNRSLQIGLGMVVAAFLTASLAAQTSSPAPTSSSPQDQAPLGDYAKKVRKDQPKAKPKVFDNDNIPTDDKLSVIGEQPATTAANTTPADDKDTASKNPDDENSKKQAQWKAWHDKLAAQKDSIDLLGRELDVLQREYQLRAAAMYADAGNRLRNQAQWDKEDADYKQKIADKQKALDDGKQKLTDMQEEARKAGVPSSMIDQ
jgi:hypothetical protein